jgi:hypothetical protein
MNLSCVLLLFIIKVARFSGLTRPDAGLVPGSNGLTGQSDPVLTTLVAYMKVESLTLLKKVKVEHYISERICNPNILKF